MKERVCMQVNEREHSPVLPARAPWTVRRMKTGSMELFLTAWSCGWRKQLRWWTWRWWWQHNVCRCWWGWFCEHLEELAISAGDNPLDETWLPPKQAKRVAKWKGFIGQPKEYKKGHDIGSKAKHTKQHYRKLLANQTSLIYYYSTGAGANIVIVKWRRTHSKKRSGVQCSSWMPVWQRSYTGLSIVLGSSCLHIEWDSLGRLQNGQWRSRNSIVRCPAELWCLLKRFSTLPSTYHYHIFYSIQLKIWLTQKAVGKTLEHCFLAYFDA